MPLKPLGLAPARLESRVISPLIDCVGLLVNKWVVPRIQIANLYLTTDAVWRKNTVEMMPSTFHSIVCLVRLMVGLRIGG